MGAVGSLTTCCHPLWRCLLTIAQLVITYFTSAPDALLGRWNVSLVPGSRSVSKAAPQGLPLLLESRSLFPKVLKPLGFSTVHPLLSGLVHATREPPACVCPRAPERPSRCMGRMSQPQRAHSRQPAWRGAFCPVGNTTSSMNEKGFKKRRNIIKNAGSLWWCLESHVAEKRPAGMPILDQSVLEVNEDSQGQRALGLWDCCCAAENWEKGEAASQTQLCPCRCSWCWGSPGSRGGQVPGAGPAAHRGDGGKELFFGDSCLGLQGKASSKQLCVQAARGWELKAAVSN